MRWYGILSLVHPLTGVIPSHGTRYPLRGGLRRVYLGGTLLTLRAVDINPNHNISPTFGPSLEGLDQDGDVWDVV